MPAGMRNASVVHGFKRHAGRHRTVPNDGHGFAVFALEFGGHGHA